MRKGVTNRAYLGLIQIPLTSVGFFPLDEAQIELTDIDGHMETHQVASHDMEAIKRIGWMVVTE